MNSTTLASGGGGVIAGAIVVLLSYILSFWHIELPPDVVTALTVLLYFVGHMILDRTLNPTVSLPIPAPTVTTPAPAPTPAPQAPAPSPPAPTEPPIYPKS